MAFITARSVARDAAGLLALCEVIRDKRAPDLLRDLKQQADDAIAAETTSVQQRKDANEALAKLTEQAVVNTAKEQELRERDARLAALETDHKARHEALQERIKDHDVRVADFEIKTKTAERSLKQREEQLQSSTVTLQAALDRQQKKVDEKAGELAEREKRVRAMEVDVQGRLARIKEIAA